MTLRISIAFLLMIGTCCPRAYAAQEPDQLAAQIDEYLAAYHDNAQFSGSALVAEDGELVYRGAFGLANADWQLANRVDTKFKLASVSKQFTAMLVLLLVEDGKLELAAPIARYLPGYPSESGEKVTVHHLLNHTSGIPNYTNRPGFMQSDALHRHTTDEFVAEFCSDPLEFEPGAFFHYSNSGYYLLAAIIESATGQSYGEALRERVLEPLEMHDTGHDDQNLVLKNRATGYHELLGERRNARRVDATSFVGAGSLYSTVDDLWKWDQALRSQELLKGELEQKMFTQGKGNYGYGWFVDRDDPDEPVFSHKGVVSGFSAMILRSPERGRCIVLLSNSVGSLVNEAVLGIAEILNGNTPKAPAVEPDRALARRVLDDGIDAGLETFAGLLESVREQRIERGINGLGYQLLGQGRANEALRLLEFNTRAFPEVANTWDSLGEANLQTGKSQLALKSYRKALELDHASPTAIAMLMQLEPTRSASSHLASAGSLQALRERDTYATLDKQAVEALARAAETQWPTELANFTYERVEHFSAGGTAHWISIWLHEKTGLEFALVPGGTFQMGSPTSEADRKEDELQHWVNLDPFLIARTECTHGAWAKLAKEAGVEKDPSFFKGSDLFPVQNILLRDVIAWCQPAGLALPTEAQWEFSCRAGTTSAWTMGADKRELSRFANLGSSDCPQDWIDHPLKITEPWSDGYGDAVSEAGSFESNAFGLFDVHGNVREWCRDNFMSYDVQVDSGTGLRPGISSDKVARGGSFNHAARVARSALRHRNQGPVHRHFGFRPALDLPFPISLEGWPSETFTLPPGFAPDLPAGTESLRFAPGWRDPSSENFWSYAFIMWIDEAAPDAARVDELLNSYYDGIMLTFAKNAGKDIGSDPAQVDVVRTAPGHFEAKMHVIDAFATFEAIDVRVLIDTVAGTDGHSAVSIRLSLQPAEHVIWRSLEAAIASIQEP